MRKAYQATGISCNVCDLRCPSVRAGRRPCPHIERYCVYIQQHDVKLGVVAGTCDWPQLRDSMSQTASSKDSGPTYLVAPDPEVQAWMSSEHDMYLIVQGLRLPVHRVILAKWSRVLAQCIMDTAPPTYGDGRREASSKLQVPIDGEVATVKSLLTLLYANSPSSELSKLLASRTPSMLMGVLRLAHKYDMPALLERADTMMAASARSDFEIEGQSISMALKWAALACDLSLVKFRKHMSQYLMRNAIEAVKRPEASELPSEFLVELISGCFHVIQTARQHCFDDHARYCEQCRKSGGGCVMADSYMSESVLNEMLRTGKLPS